MTTGLFTHLGANRNRGPRRVVHTWTHADDTLLMDCIAEGLSFTKTARVMDMTDDQVSGRFERLRAAMGAQAR